MLIVGLHGYFDRTEREMVVLAGFALLIWLPALRCPPAATVVAGIIAEASLYIYLTHYQVYPLFGEHRLLGVVASIVVGVLLTQLVSVAAVATGSAEKRRQLMRGSVRVRLSRSAMSPSCAIVAAMAPSVARPGCRSRRRDHAPRPVIGTPADSIRSARTAR